MSQGHIKRGTLGHGQQRKADGWHALALWEGRGFGAIATPIEDSGRATQSYGFNVFGIMRNRSTTASDAGPVDFR